MDNNDVFSFFSYPFNYVKTPEQALAIMERIPMYTQIVFLQDSSKHVLPALKSELDKRLGDLFKIRTSGPWNRFFKRVSVLEGAVAAGEMGGGDASDIWFISMVPPEEIFSVLKRHRVINNLTNREEYFLKTLPFGEEHDELIALTLESQMCYISDTDYKSLSVKQAFDLTSFEGCRFMRPVHDQHACALIMEKRVA